MYLFIYNKLVSSMSLIPKQLKYKKTRLICCCCSFWKFLLLLFLQARLGQATHPANGNQKNKIKIHLEYQVVSRQMGNKLRPFKIMKESLTIFVYLSGNNYEQNLNLFLLNALWCIRKCTRNLPPPFIEKNYIEIASH